MNANYIVNRLLETDLDDFSEIEADILKADDISLEANGFNLNVNGTYKRTIPIGDDTYPIEVHKGDYVLNLRHWRGGELAFARNVLFNGTYKAIKAAVYMSKCIEDAGSLDLDLLDSWLASQLLAILNEASSEDELDNIGAIESILKSDINRLEANGFEFSISMYTRIIPKDADSNYVIIVQKELNKLSILRVEGDKTVFNRDVQFYGTYKTVKAAIDVSRYIENSDIEDLDQLDRMVHSVLMKVLNENTARKVIAEASSADELDAPENAIPELIRTVGHYLSEMGFTSDDNLHGHGQFPAYAKEYKSVYGDFVLKVYTGGGTNSIVVLKYRYDWSYVAQEDGIEDYVTVRIARELDAFFSNPETYKYYGVKEIGYQVNRIINHIQISNLR